MTREEVFDDFRKLPEPFREHFFKLEELLGHVDGKDFVLWDEGRETCSDEGTLFIGDEFVPELNAIARAILALPQEVPDGWRPINALEEKHNKVLLWVVNGYSHDHIKTGIRRDGFVYSVFDDGESAGWHPEQFASHWMPLPPSPGSAPTENKSGGERDAAVRSFVNDYEFRCGTETCYTPNENERAMLEDFAWGLLDAIKPTPPAVAEDVVEAALRKERLGVLDQIQMIRNVDYWNVDQIRAALDGFIEGTRNLLRSDKEPV